MNWLKGHLWIVALLLAFGAMGSLHAQTVYPKSLVIELNSQSSKEVYTIRSLQKITFAQGDMRVQFNDGTPLQQTKIAQIKKLYFSTKDKPTSVEDVDLSTTSRLSWYEDNDMLHIVGLPEGSCPVAVYRIDGSCIFSAEQINANSPIDMRSWPDGYYIVKINDVTLKIIKQ